MDTVKPSAPAQKPAGAPAVIKTGMDSHGMRFVPREVITDYKDRLYHGKPEMNYKGIPYRQPKRIERANVGDRLLVMGKQPISDTEIRELSEDYYARFGRKPAAITYAGRNVKRGRGLTGLSFGYVFVDLIPVDGDFEPFVSAYEGETLQAPV